MTRPVLNKKNVQVLYDFAKKQPFINYIAEYNSVTNLPTKQVVDRIIKFLKLGLHKQAQESFRELKVFYPIIDLEFEDLYKHDV